MLRYGIPDKLFIIKAHVREDRALFRKDVITRKINYGVPEKRDRYHKSQAINKKNVNLDKKR